jgi:hypothetical protein
VITRHFKHARSGIRNTWDRHVLPLRELVAASPGKRIQIVLQTFAVLHHIVF